MLVFGLDVNVCVVGRAAMVVRVLVVVVMARVSGVSSQKEHEPQTGDC
jgi:hypothetical protein